MTIPPESRGQSYESSYNRTSKEKRAGVIPVLIAVGILGAAYALVNFFVREKHTFYLLPLAPDGCFTDPALWYASDFKYVWHHRCHLYDLQYGI